MKRRNWTEYTADMYLKNKKIKIIGLLCEAMQLNKTSPDEIENNRRSLSLSFSLTHSCLYYVYK